MCIFSIFVNYSINCKLYQVGISKTKYNLGVYITNFNFIYLLKLLKFEQRNINKYEIMHLKKYNEFT